MIDIVDRLKFDAVRVEAQFSKGVAGNIQDAIAEITKLRAERDAALKENFKIICEMADMKVRALTAEGKASSLKDVVQIFLPPGNEAMEDIIWEGQPDDAPMTIRIRYGQFKRARALLATSGKDAT